jgi:hypothetical protein
MLQQCSARQRIRELKAGHSNLSKHTRTKNWVALTSVPPLVSG